MPKKKQKKEDQKNVESAGLQERKLPDVELSQELVRYDFNQDELLDLADKMIDLSRRVDRLEAEKKSAASEFDSQIKKTKLEGAEVVSKYHEKFEMRTMHCYCVRIYKKRMALFFRADQIELEDLKAWEIDALLDAVDAGTFPAEVVKQRDLKPWELQRELEFKERAEAEAAGAGGDPGGPASGEVDSETLVDEEMEAGEV